MRFSPGYKPRPVVKPAGGMVSRRPLFAPRPPSSPLVNQAAAIANPAMGRTPGGPIAPPAPTATAPATAAPASQTPDFRTDPGYIADVAGIGLRYTTGKGQLQTKFTRGREDLATALTGYEAQYGQTESHAKENLAQELAGLAFQKPGEIRGARRGAHSAGLAFSSELDRTLGDIETSFGMREQGIQTGYRQSKEQRDLARKAFLEENATAGKRLTEDETSELAALEGEYGPTGTKVMGAGADALARVIANTIARPPAPPESAVEATKPPSASTPSTSPSPAPARPQIASYGAGRVTPPTGVSAPDLATLLSGRPTGMRRRSRR